jgi:hypothetical protein
VAFVAIDEAKRSTIAEETIKSVDFIVVGPDTAKLVVDVKGRKFPSGSKERPQTTWQNWTEEQDVGGLSKWATHFGAEYRGVLAFVYQIQSPYELPTGTTDVFEFRESIYLMRAIAVNDYRRHMRPRSEKWGTVHLPVAAFRDIIRPFSEFLQPDGPTLFDDPAEPY